MDPLSEILALLKPKTWGFRGLDAGGTWALAFPADDGIKCYAIDHGACWLVMAGGTAPVRLDAGDFVLLPGGQAFRLCSDCTAPAIDAYGFFLAVPAGEFAVLNKGGAFSGVGGYFDFDSMHADRLRPLLPPVIHISATANEAALRGSIDRLMRELRTPLPGSSLLAEHLAQALLIEALRHHLVDGSPHNTGWLFALADRRMNAVISAIHAEPGRKWTLHTLANIAGMSRSSFAARFKQTVGESAMDYLTRWRMVVAAEKLTNAGMPIATVAPLVGYESESAFGATFKRVMGHPPRHFAKAKVRANVGWPETSAI